MFQYISSIVVTTGLIAVRLYNERQRSAHIKDAIKVTVKAIVKLNNERKLAQEPPSSCHDTSGQWKDGETLYE